MKKIVVSVLLAGMLVFSMTACGNKEEAVETGTATETENTGETAPEESDSGEEQVKTESTSTVIYIGTDGNMKEYECEASDNLTPEFLISTMAALTGWNLDLADEVTVGKGGMTVSFAKTSSLFVGPPEEQSEEFFVYDAEQLAAMILDSIQYTLQHNFVDAELGDPSSLDIYYCMEGNQPLELTNIGKVIPMDQPYSGLSADTQTQSAEGGEDAGEEPANILEGEFIGFIDNNSVEVNIEDGGSVFRVEDEEVRAILNNFEKGTLFTFESELDGESWKIVKVIGE